jgi:hypothetical protein
VRRTGYYEPYEHYARVYGVSLRTIKRWGPKEKAPLDDAPAMLRWWTLTHPTMQVPEGVARAAGEAGGEGRPRAEPQGGGGPEARREAEVPEEAAEEGYEPDEGELGLERAYRRLEVLEARLHREAHKPGMTDPYLRSVGRLTAAGEKLRKELEALGRLIPKEEAASALAEYAAAIGREVDGLYDGMATLLGLPATRGLRERWLEVTRELRERMQRDVFEVGGDDGEADGEEVTG